MDPKNQKQPLKKIIPQLLISVSLFSFLVSYSSLYNFSSSSSSLISPKFHHYFSANSFQLNKNYLFLICNGLLVFLAKTSGFIQPPIARDLNVDVLIGDTTFHKYVLEEETTADPAGDGGEKSAAAAADGLEEVSIFIAESEEEEGEIGAAANDAEKHENEPDCRSCWLFDEDENEDEDEEVEEEMSTEELNQKFEAFIRKMKEEIIINEARQKALMLN